MIKEIKANGTFACRRAVVGTYWLSATAAPVMVEFVPPHFLITSGGASSLPSVSDRLDAGFASLKKRYAVSDVILNQ